MINIAKSSEKALNIYDMITKWAIYLLFFLMPVFFLPFTSDSLDFNKQALLIILAFVSLFFWMIKSLVSGGARANLNFLLFPFVIFILIYSVSSFFSLYRYGSFWGFSSAVSDGLISIIAFFILYFLISSALSKKEIIRCVYLLCVSSLLAMIYAVFQIFGKFILAFDFSKSAGFNTIGSVNGAGLFAFSMLPIAISLFMVSKRVVKMILGATVAFIFIVLLVVNFKIAWIGASIGSAIMIIFISQKKELFSGSKIVLPMFFLAVSLLFVFFNFSFLMPDSRPVEVYLNQKSGFDIALNTLKEKPVLGSGPGTFVFDFSKFKNPELNNSAFWNARFEDGGTKAITMLATTGILGSISFAMLVSAFFIFGIAAFFRNKNIEQEEDNVLWGVGCGIFASFCSLVFACFFYRTNMVLDFLFFSILGIMSGLFFRRQKEISLKSSSIFTLAITFIFTIIFITGLGILISEAQRYAAEANYYSGLKSYSKGDIDASISKMESAIKINPKSDAYLRDISQAYLAKLSIELKKKDNSDQENQIIQALIRGAVNSSVQATDISSSNASNWSVRGFIYSNLIPLFSGFDENAIKAYDEAIKLEPSSPYFPVQQGIAHMTKYYSLDKDSADRKKEISAAKERFSAAIELKQDYAQALFQLAMIYNEEGRTSEAISKLEEAKKAAPFDVGLAFQLGLVYYQNKDYGKAKTEFERALLIDSKYANALYFLGLVYDQQNDRQKATEMFEKVLVLNPDNEEIKKILDNLKNGKKALEQISEQVPPQVPIEEGQDKISNNANLKEPSPSPAPKTD